MRDAAGGEVPRVLDGSWRRGYVRRGHEQSVGGAAVLHRLPRAERLADCRAFTSHPEGGVAVCATAQVGRNSQPSDSIAFLQLGHAPLRHSVVPSHFPAVCVAWGANDTLAFGTTQGCVMVYPGVSPYDPTHLSSFDTNTGHAFSIGRAKETRSVSIPPGKWGYSSCITYTEISPCGGRILGLEENRLHVWDTAGGVKVGQPVKASSGTVLSASFSRLSRDVIATGSATGGAKIFDTRCAKENSVWKSPVAHAGVVRCIRFAPLIAHHCLTATDSGDLKVWDTRMSGAVGAVCSTPHNIGVIRGVEWSPLHCDFIAAAGLTGETKLFCCTGTSPSVAAVFRHDSPSVGISFSTTAADTPVSAVSSASISGEVTTMGITPTLLEAIASTSAPYRQDMPGGVAPQKPGGGGECPEGAVSRRVEACRSEGLEECRRLVYLRHFKQAEQRVRETVNKLVSIGDPETALEVAAVLHKHEPQPLPRGSLFSDAIAAFQEDLRICRKGVPPLMPYTPGTLQRNQELNVRLGYLHCEGRWGDIANAVGEHIGLSKILDRWRWADQQQQQMPVTQRQGSGIPTPRPSADASAAAQEEGGGEGGGAAVSGHPTRGTSFLQQPSVGGGAAGSFSRRGSASGAALPSFSLRGVGVPVPHAGAEVDLHSDSIDKSVESLFSEEEMHSLSSFLMALQPESYHKVVEGLSRFSWTLGADFFLLTWSLLEDLIGMEESETAATASTLLGESLEDELPIGAASDPTSAGAAAPQRSPPLQPAAPPRARQSSCSSGGAAAEGTGVPSASTTPSVSPSNSPRGLGRAPHGGATQRRPPESLSSALLELRRLRLVTGLCYAPDAAARIASVVEGVAVDGERWGLRAIHSGAVVRLYVSCLLQGGEEARAVWAIDAVVETYPKSPAAAALLRQLRSLKAGLEAHVEREKAKLAGESLHSRPLIDAAHSICSFAVEVAVMCRRLVCPAISAQRLVAHHTPHRDGSLMDMVKVASKRSEDMLGVLKRLFRQVIAAPPAVRKECEAHFSDMATSLEAAIEQTSVEGSREGAPAFQGSREFDQLTKQAVANSVSMLKTLRTC